MFENKTFETILEDALSEVEGNLDTRENGIIYTAFAMLATELNQMYINMNAMIDLMFALTSGGEWLEKSAVEYDVYKNEAIKAKRRAIFNTEVSVGERFYAEGVYFRVVSEDEVECEESGEIGNTVPVGTDMLPLNNIDNLTEATLGETIIAGAEEESDESLLQRYLVERRKEAGSGNKDHYKKWAEEVVGVGKALVYPLWDGPGTVKVVIANAEMQPASPELVQSVKDYIDPTDGEGDGEAPTGAIVTVASASHKDVEITAKVVLNGNSISSVTSEIESEIRKLFKNIAFTNAELKITQINNILFENKWISDYSNVTINGDLDNLPISGEEIPNLLEVVLYADN